MKTFIFSEDGWKAEVEVVEDTSDAEWSRYKLKVIRTLRHSTIHETPEDGTVFDVSNLNGAAYGGMWQLQILDEESDV